ncbi:MFS transporter [Paractinoplanes atraurantiacus]|uniref:Major Facilitator Superfamily protein n=1 Tax=Paractinoplanes atraurantiacus TaxID=1036182 RepID=A0A285HA29_9ACTN|nr:MFS transporter [Actinoplanes atraurantiacus]SNY32609.1 Major Facilitator Superfamily protein [Actinoplanes atraurantiacus]
MRRNAVLLILISILSGFGSTAMSIAAGLWVLDLTGSVSFAALTAVCLYLPTFAGPWLGGLADRLPRRPLLIGTDLALGVVLLTLLAVHSAAGVWLIFAVLLFRGVSYVVSDAGETAILPSALPRELLGDVNGWRSSAQEGMKLVAPLAGAALYAWHGATPVILLSAAMPLLSAACYAFLRIGTAAAPTAQDAAGAASAAMGEAAAEPAARCGADAESAVRGGASAESAARGGAGTESAARGGARAEPAAWSGAGAEAAGASVVVARAQAGAEGGERRRGGLGEGLRALFGIADVRTPVVVAGVAIGMSGLCNAAVLSHLVHDLGLPSTHLGFLATAQGAGSIVGGLIVGRLLARSSPVAVAALGSVVFAAGCLSSSLPWWAAMITGSVLIGLGLPWALIAGITAVQTRTPDHLLGRVAATATTVMFGPVALGIPLGSALIHLGTVLPLWIAAAVTVTTAALARRRHPAAALPVGSAR